MFTSSGIIEAFPVAKSIPRRPDSWWMVLKCDEELVRYYRYLFDRRQYGLPPKWPMQPPSWGSHITIVRDEKPTKPDLWMSCHGKRVTFTYEPVVRGNDEYWWLQVRCEELLDVREALGLNRFPEFSLHLTIGRYIIYKQQGPIV